MPFTISKPPFSNKPPPPVPIPPIGLFSTAKSLADGRMVWLSIPQPDYLSIIVPITPTVYGNGVSASLSVAAFANGLGKYFQDQPFNAHWAGGNVWWNVELKESLWREASLTMGSRQAVVYFSLLKSKKNGHRLRIDLNPRKLGKKGFAQLSLVLGGANAPFDLPNLLGQAWVTRVDIAVDVVGVHISEVVGKHKDQGKRVLYVGSDGALESLYIYRKRNATKLSGDPPKKLKPGPSRIGTNLVRIYDRVREREANGKEPPFGPSPVTRIEVIKRLAKRPLQDISKIPNPLERLRIGFIESQFQVLYKGHAGPWLRYVAIRHTHTSKDTLRLLGETGDTALGTLDTVPFADLLDADNWKAWEDGMKFTGLADFIGAS